MTETEIVHHLQCAVNAPDYRDAILQAAGVTEQLDPTQTGSFYDDGSQPLPWRIVVTPLTYDPGKAALACLLDKLEAVREDLVDLFRQLAAGKTITFQAGRRFRILDNPMAQRKGTPHLLLVSRFCVPGGDGEGESYFHIGYSQVVPEAGGYWLPPHCLNPTPTLKGTNPMRTYRVTFTAQFDHQTSTEIRAGHYEVVEDGSLRFLTVSDGVTHELARFASHCWASVLKVEDATPAKRISAWQ